MRSFKCVPVCTVSLMFVNHWLSVTLPPSLCSFLPSFLPCLLSVNPCSFLSFVLFLFCFSLRVLPCPSCSYLFLPFPSFSFSFFFSFLFSFLYSFSFSVSVSVSPSLSLSLRFVATMPVFTPYFQCFSTEHCNLCRLLPLLSTAFDTELLHVGRELARAHLKDLHGSSPKWGFIHGTRFNDVL